MTIPQFQGQNPSTVLSTDAQEVMYNNILNVLMGTFGGEWQVTETRKVATADAAVAVAGRVAYVDQSTGLFEIGLQPNHLPFFIKPALGYEGQAKDGNVYGGECLAIPALVGQKIQTTEFVAGTYAINQPLTAVDDETANRGMVTAGTYYDDTICGVVIEDGVSAIVHGVRAVLTLYTYFLPAISTGSFAGS